MGFAFTPNGSDHNGVDDAVKRSKGNKWLLGARPKDTEGGLLPLLECEVWREGCSVSADRRLSRLQRKASRKISGMQLLFEVRRLRLVALNFSKIIPVVRGIVEIRIQTQGLG